MVKDYVKPRSLDEAFEALAMPGSIALAGGTFALIGEVHGTKADIERAVDIGGLLSEAVERRGSELYVGAGCSFQALAEAPAAPACLRAAALTMANRNTRNRATVGGNLGANKSCASLVPILLALGAQAEYKLRDSGPRHIALEQWLAAPQGLVLSLSIPIVSGTRAASGRASRTSCDLATATVGLAFRLEGNAVRDLRVALGGFGPHAMLFPAITALFEGKSLPPKADIEKAVEPLLSALSDKRGGADYKKRRGAVLVADALHAAEVLA
ncbi:MAG TPA: hypothetical protein DCG47_08850 [Spirochaetaceae bacterium]|jgi:putative selenate reductase FAD-binding subunit|nr:hypothetical protein [Spirochaetaceae bacterium]